MTERPDPLLADSGTSGPRDVAVREATPADIAGVLGVLDSGALQTDRERVATSIDRGGTLVAVRSRDDGAAGGDGPILGALVLVGDEIDGIAVRPRRRNQGIGRALVAAAARRRDRLVAAFDGDVRAFYERLGFAVEADDATGTGGATGAAISGDRYWGEWRRGD